MQCQKANVKHAVQFYVEDATLMDYPDQFYDMVYSRDTILHIKDKKALFEMFYRTLKPGGKVVITDYCHGDKPQHSQHFVDYVKVNCFLYLALLSNHLCIYLACLHRRYAFQFPI